MDKRVLYVFVEQCSANSIVSRFCFALCLKNLAVLLNKVLIEHKNIYRVNDEILHNCYIETIKCNCDV